ncbi:MAG TPA: hypothetical protein VF719_05285 [Abditibacteriaceae bacterium]|jgi:hypothetical protein
MKSWSQALKDSLLTGKIASVATSSAIMACGAAENRNPVAPVNAVSHMLWGDEAATHDELSVKHTFTGLALNSAANISWAVLYEKWFGEAGERGDVATSLAGGAAVAAVAYVTDYHLVPPRFTPGFEKRLSSRSLLVIYIVLALSLGLGGLRRRNL